MIPRLGWVDVMLSRNYSGGKPCQIAAALMVKVSAFDFSYFDVSRLPLDTFLR
jgi:hypothetical protein